jgi:hypothetical protein
VEKGIEDRELAKKWAAKTEEPLQRFLLSEDWDWHRFVSSSTQTVSLVNSANKHLHKELYLWLEFGNDKRDSRYYIVKDTDLYWRGGFAPVSWEELFSFATQPRPNEWGNVFLARAFGLDECNPYLDLDKLMAVFNAMRPVRDLWRGLISVSE